MKRQSPGLRLTIASALAAGCVLSSPAHAINLAPNGKGEVLIFPYYTVRNGFDTLISVTNTSDRTVLATMRLREARNGRTVREFHIAMSPYDVWTGAVTIDGTDGALVRTFDATCTAPSLDAGPNGSTQIALTPSNFDGTGALPYDNGGRALNRVQEGFIEVIEMGISTVLSDAIPATGSSIETSAQHVSGTPRNCTSIQDIFGNAGNFAGSGSGTALPGSVFASFEAPKNVLFGSATLINVGAGQAYDATPTTIQNFRATAPIIYMPGSGKPTLAHGDAGMTAIQFDRDGNLITTGNITSSIDAVSVLLMADSLTNEFANGTAGTSSSKTDWVVTFPTKHFYTDEGTNGSSSPLPPFSQAFMSVGQSCDRVDLIHADRVGRFASVPPSNVLIGPSGRNFYHSCGSMNKYSLNGLEPSGPLGPLFYSFRAELLYTSGWLSVSFPLTGLPRVGDEVVTLRSTLLGFAGLPAIGFAVIERNNSAEAGNNRNYGSGRPHVVDVIKP